MRLPRTARRTQSAIPPVGASGSDQNSDVDILGQYRANREAPGDADRRFVHSTHDVPFAVDTSDLIQRSLAVFGRWEPEVNSLIKYLLGPRDTFVDIGANIGYHALTVAATRPKTAVVAIEPFPRTFAALVQNIQGSGFDNIRAVSACIDEAPGRRTLHLPRETNLGGATLYPRDDDPTAEQHEVDCTTVDDVLTAAEIASTRLVKIDVEGAELTVLRSLDRCISTMRDDLELVIEVNPHWLSADDIDEIFAMTTRWGFRSMFVVDDGYCLEALKARPEQYFAALLQTRPLHQANLLLSRTASTFRVWPRGLS